VIGYTPKLIPNQHIEKLAFSGASFTARETMETIQSEDTFNCEANLISEQNFDVESCSPMFPSHRGSSIIPKVKGKPDDICGLGLVLQEMVTLTPHLSLREDEKDLPLPPVGKYSAKLYELLAFLTRSIKPAMRDIVNHTYLYPYYYSTGIEVARHNREASVE
jgi:hypothetical protein